MKVGGLEASEALVGLGCQQSLIRKAGPLGPAAARWLGHWPVPGLGAAGLRALCEAVERWAQEDPSEDADRDFVEGAGAMLALLLLDHVGEGAHKSRDGEHRIRLGAYGFFDPFAAIEECLEHARPRSALARNVQRAEAEAAGKGPLSRVVSAVASSLDRSSCDLWISDQFECHLSLVNADGADAGSMDVRRVVATTRDQGLEAVHAAVGKLVRMLEGQQGAELSWGDARDRVFPRLVRPADLDDLGGQLWHRPFLPGLDIALLVQYDDRSRYVSEAEAARWGHGVVRRALRNLADTSTLARMRRESTPAGDVIIARSGDGKDAARLLLPGLFDVLRAELGDRLRVAVPHRDMLIACADEPSVLEAVEKRVANDFARAPHRLSEQLFHLGPRGPQAA